MLVMHGKVGELVMHGKKIPEVLFIGQRFVCPLAMVLRLFVALWFNIDAGSWQRMRTGSVVLVFCLEHGLDGGKPTQLSRHEPTVFSSSKTP